MLGTAKLHLQLNLLEACKELQTLQQKGVLGDGVIRHAQKLLRDAGIPAHQDMPVALNMLRDLAIEAYIESNS